MARASCTAAGARDADRRAHQRADRRRARRAERASSARATISAAAASASPARAGSCYEITHTPIDDGQDFDGQMLRIFEAGHRFEALSIRWLRAAGFDLRTQRADGGQFGFSAAGGRHPRPHRRRDRRRARHRHRWPALFEHKALNAKSWPTSSSAACELSKPIYFAQVQIYMAYMELGDALFTALNKDSQALHHEVVGFDPPKRRRSPTRPSTSSAPRKRASCRRASPPTRTSISAAVCAYAPALLGGRAHDHHPSPQQAAAIPAIKDWYREPHEQQQVFRLFGYAGSGKTTITAHAIEALGLAPKTGTAVRPAACCIAAFTGKAALVMTRKGTPASTIHSLIYRVSEATPEEIERVEQEVADLRASLGSSGRRPSVCSRWSGSSALELRLCDIHKPRFVLNEQSLVREAELIVLDEVSMVGARWRATCWPSASRSWCWAIPGQLPPIKGDGAFTERHPT